MTKYGGLFLYGIDFGKRYFIDDEENSLIGNPDHPDVTSTDHEYYCIHDDLVDKILETDQNSDIILKAIQKEP